MDVFKYLKKTDTLLEASASEEAHKLGLDYAGYGKWKDPKTGKTTHKSVKQNGQTVLQKLDQPEAPEQETQKTEPQQKTLSQFRKDVPAPQPEAPVSDQMNRNVPGGPTADALAAGDKAEVIKQLSRGRENVQSAARKAQIARQADQMIADDEAEREAEEAAAAAEAEAAAQEIQTSPDIITLDQAVREVDREDEADAEPDPLDELLASIRDKTSVLEDESDENTTSFAEMSSDGGLVDKINDILNQRDKQRKEFERILQESYQTEQQLNAPLKRARQMIDNVIENIPDEPTRENLKNKFIAVAAIAATFPKSKVRSGSGARSLLAEERELLLNPENMQRNLDGFGDGSWDQVHAYGDSMKPLKSSMSDKEWDGVAQLWWDSQPKEIRDRFEGAGGLGGKGKENHYAGVDSKGNVKKGKANNKARTMALVKTYLQQGGLDGYTGLPLRFEHMEPDHIRGFSSKIGGVEPTEQDRFNADHPDNWIWTSVGVNNIKSDLDMQGFIDSIQKEKKGKKKEDLKIRDLLFQDEGVRYLTDDTTDFAKSFVEEYVAEDGETYNVLSDSLNSKMIEEREKQQLDLIKSLQDQGAQVAESRLLKDIFAAGGQVPSRYRLGLPSQNKEDVRERSQVRMGDNAIREMFSVMAGKPKEEQAQIQRAWLESWRESLDTIKDNFSKYDRGEDYDRDDFVFQPEPDASGRQVIRGGPSLKKLFQQSLLNKLPEEVGQRIAKQIQFRESIEFDDNEVEVLTEMSGRDRIERLKKSLRDVQVF